MDKSPAMTFLILLILSISFQGICSSSVYHFSQKSQPGRASFYLNPLDSTDESSTGILFSDREAERLAAVRDILTAAHASEGDRLLVESLLAENSAARLAAATAADTNNEPHGLDFKAADGVADRTTGDDFLDNELSANDLFMAKAAADLVASKAEPPFDSHPNEVRAPNDNIVRVLGDISSDTSEIISLGSGSLRVSLDTTTGIYSVAIGETLWLKSSPTFITVAGSRIDATTGGGLNLVGFYKDSGMDNLGAWTSVILKYEPLVKPSTSCEIHAEIRAYFDIPELVLFAQHFPTGVNGSSKGLDVELSSGFPSFYVDSSPLGYLAYGGIMFGDTGKAVGKWNPTDVLRIRSGLDSGPIVLFDGAGDSLVLSPWSSFMSMSTSIDHSVPGRPTVSWGVMGSASSIPPGFSVWTSICHSPEGVNKAMHRWGELLRKKYNRGTAYRDSDLTNNYVGYYTDNGAYYYYLTEQGQNYEQTLLNIKDYAEHLKIPYRYVQYDSWFYPKGPDHGVTEWVSMLNIFPDGMQYLWNKTGWISVAHNRWWSDKTVYAKQNGGKYEFIVEHDTQKALPIDSKFWMDLMRESRKWGLIVYEQDWLNDQFNQMKATRTNVLIAQEWLTQMGGAALNNEVNIQYCMAPSRAALMSLLVPNVVQGRVSVDYQPGNDQWKIGISSMLAHALGVAPFKDNFWTTSVQPGNVYNLTEPYPELQSVVATLSTGPVAPADKIGHSNADLIMRSCNADGLILKPSKPAMSVDEQLYKRALKGFHGEVWTTYSMISSLMFGIVFAADFNKTETFPLYPEQAGFGPTFPHSFVFSWSDTTMQSLQPFTSDQPLLLKGCYLKPFCLYLTTPLILVGSSEILLAGEMNKWVTMSPQRISSIESSESELIISLEGSAGEAVDFTYSINGSLVKVQCILSTAGRARLLVLAKRCILY